MNRELRNVEINKIFVLNPRERNKQIARLRFPKKLFHKMDMNMI